jgi:hypothetical protein
MGNVRSIFFLAIALDFATAGTLCVRAIHAQAPTATSARQLGAVKAMEGNALTIVTKDGTVTVSVATDASVLQLAPGSTDLKTAQPARMSDIAVGDKVLTGKAGDTATASRVIVMKSGDIAARNAAEQADWQKRGFSGLVKAIDGGVITVTAGSRTVKVTTTPRTVFRRYAADSIKFQDSVAGMSADVHAGDQLSARGDKSADGSDVAADEVVTGSFTNLSGLLTAVDAVAGTVSFRDLTSKKQVTVKITANADLRKLPAQAAAMIASRPGGASGGTPSATPAGGPPASASPPGARVASSGRPAGSGNPDGPGGMPGGSARAGMDLSRMLSRLPAGTVADLKAGDAVMVVASPTATASSFTAITLLSGVDALLTAAPGSQPITLSPWSLGAPDAGGAGGPQ